MMTIQWSLRNLMLLSVIIFMVISFFLLVQHEMAVMLHPRVVSQQQDSKVHLTAGDTHRDSEELIKVLGKVGGSRGNRVNKKKPPARLRKKEGSNTAGTKVKTSADKSHRKNILFSGRNGHKKIEDEHPAMFPPLDGRGRSRTDDTLPLPESHEGHPKATRSDHYEVTSVSSGFQHNQKELKQQKQQQPAQQKGSEKHVHFDLSEDREIDREIVPSSDIDHKMKQRNANRRSFSEGIQKLNMEKSSKSGQSDTVSKDTDSNSRFQLDKSLQFLDKSVLQKHLRVESATVKEELLDQEEEAEEMDLNADDQRIEADRFAEEKRGNLTCNGQLIDSEVIYWKQVPGDDVLESPITPHHGEHHRKFLTFEYDAGGWNNIRMGLECLIVVAHAMGRTLVVPPQEHLYLIRENHKDAEDKMEHDEMGFEDFFDLDLLRSQKGFHILHMEEFLAREGVTGHLKGILPPYNTTKINHGKLSRYLNKVADMKPSWWHRFLAFPSKPGDFDMNESFRDQKVKTRMYAFSGNGDRKPIFYDKAYQQAKHIHLPADQEHRILQHHYDPDMQSFYRRFVRDYMRYKDRIQCAGHELVSAVRAEAMKEAPNWGGEYYAMHIRRGDFQYKDVKISAAQMLQNMKHANGTAFIPSGALVYISTDDPDGVCLNCAVKGKLCKDMKSPKPIGCPEDPSYKAFIDAGFKIRFLKDFVKRGHLKGVNPNTYGMIESIVCSRAKVFVGTYYSTFTGYIHRLRGYHGRGEDSYYHSTRFVHQLQMKKSVGQGWPREWRAGWTDDEGGLI